MIIKLAQVIPISEVNGPGCRAVIWVQGCRKRCRGCWNPDFLPFGSAWAVSPSELFSHVKAHTNDFASIEGVTFSGGEPFEQWQGVEAAARAFRNEDLSVMCYSGYTLEEIQALPSAPLLNQIDILVDGEYEVDRAAHLLWRGSANQKVHFLTPRYLAFADRVHEPIREFEIVLKSDDVIMTGFPG